MPKNKKPLESTRTSSRRQASKEALKQLQLLLDDEDDDAFVIPDDDDKKDVRPEPPPKKRAVSPIMESPPPKKKYKLSHRKSSDGNDRDVIVLKSISNSHYVPKENTLELECFVEELSDVQKERQQKAELEEAELQAKLDELLKSNKAEIVYQGEMSTAVEVNELISNCGEKWVFKPNELPQLGEVSEQAAPTFQLVMDPRLGIIVGSVQSTNQVQISAPTITKSKLQIASAVKAVATLPQNTTTSPPARNMRSRRGGMSTPPALIQARTNNTIPTRGSNIGVMTRGNSNTPRSNNSASTRALPQAPVSSPSIQTRGMKTVPTIQTRNNKATPPSSKRPVAVIPAEKPKQVVDLTSDDNRNQADNREISFNKLQGKTYPSLVVVARPHLRVTDLTIDRPKLDAKVKSVLMHPPTKFTEWLIQKGLIRAEQKCPVHSNTQLKLGMYSDVAKFPFSGGYVWISECCPQRFVSVFNGSIFEGSPHPPVVMLKLIYHWSCQTNIQNVTQWVKVDNLYVKGVYTWLRGVCTVAVQSRLRQLGGPGSRIEVGVISLGTTSHDGNQRQVKVEVLGVLESSTKYVRLRAVEPMPEGDRNFRKKFSKILEPILSWVHPASTIVTDLTVDKATLHHMGFTNVVQTTSNDYNQSNRTIMEFLRRIVPRMFQNTLSLLSRQIIQQFLDELVWREWFGITSQMAFDNIITHLAEQTRSNTQTPLVLKLNKVATNPFRSWNINSSMNQAPSNSSTPAPTPQVSTTAAVTPAKTPVAEVRKYGRKKTNSPQVQVVQERPSKPVSPDVPEQMVPLENYYYGTIDSNNTSPMKVTLNMKCPFCKSSFDNNILLQNHLFKHAHNVSNDAYLCRYCLTSVSTANELIHHVNKCHPGDTKFNNGFVCLICEIHYMNPFVLGKHMSKEHIPHELPYQCGSCPFRCSNHKQVIDHFYSKHDGDSSIQCPFCLKSTTVWSSGRNVAQNIHYFIQHLQKHQKKQFAKRCGKCNLWFVQKEVLKEHQQKMHISLRGKVGLVPYPSPRNGVMVPKSKTDKNPCDAEVINFSSLYYNVTDNSICKECNQTISSSKHFPSFDNCQNPNCQYSTCCAIAMMTHNAKCKGLNFIIPTETLPYEMFCVCGFRDIDGNAMAKHLAVCEKKSAYSSEAEAKSATVMHSMLDILGLVRKPEENKTEKPSDNSFVSEKSEESSKISNKKIDFNEINILSDEEEMEENVENQNKADEHTSEIIQEKKKSSENYPTHGNDGITEEIDEQIPETILENVKESGGERNSDIIELDEDDTIMDEVMIDSPRTILNEENRKNVEESVDNDESKTEEKITDFSKQHIRLEEKSPSPEPRISETNSNHENEEVHCILSKNEMKITTEHETADIVEEVEENFDKTESEYSEQKKAEKDYLPEEKETELKTEAYQMETEVTERSIESDCNIEEMETDNEIKEIESDNTEKENKDCCDVGNEIEQSQSDIETLPQKDIEKEDEIQMNTKQTEIEKQIETKYIEEKIDAIEESEVDTCEKQVSTDNYERSLETDHSEQRIEKDFAEKDFQVDQNRMVQDDVINIDQGESVITSHFSEKAREEKMKETENKSMEKNSAAEEESNSIEVQSDCSTEEQLLFHENESIVHMSSDSITANDRTQEVCLKNNEGIKENIEENFISFSKTSDEKHNEVQNDSEEEAKNISDKHIESNEIDCSDQTTEFLGKKEQGEVIDAKSLDDSSKSSEYQNKQEDTSIKDILLVEKSDVMPTDSKLAEGSTVMDVD